MTTHTDEIRLDELAGLPPLNENPNPGWENDYESDIEDTIINNTDTDLESSDSGDLEPLDERTNLNFSSNPYAKILLVFGGVCFSLFLVYLFFNMYQQASQTAEAEPQERPEEVFEDKEEETGLLKAELALGQQARQLEQLNSSSVVKQENKKPIQPSSPETPTRSVNKPQPQVQQQQPVQSEPEPLQVDPYEAQMNAISLGSFGNSSSSQENFSQQTHTTQPDSQYFDEYDEYDEQYANYSNQYQSNYPHQSDYPPNQGYPPNQYQSNYPHQSDYPPNQGYPPNQYQSNYPHQSDYPPNQSNQYHSNYPNQSDYPPNQSNQYQQISQSQIPSQSRQLELEAPLFGNNNTNYQPTPNTQTISSGTTVSAIALDAIVWSDEDLIADQQFAVALTEPVLSTNGSVLIPADSLILVQIANYTSKGFVYLEPVALIVQGRNLPLINHGIFIKAKNNDYLQAKLITPNQKNRGQVLNDILGAAGDLGALPPSISQRIDRTQRRFDNNRDDYYRNPNFWLVEEGTELSIFFSISYTLPFSPTQTPQQNQSNNLNSKTLKKLDVASLPKKLKPKQVEKTTIPMNISKEENQQQKQIETLTEDIKASELLSLSKTLKSLSKQAKFVNQDGEKIAKFPQNSEPFSSTPLITEEPKPSFEEDNPNHLDDRFFFPVALESQQTT